MMEPCHRTKDFHPATAHNFLVFPGREGNVVRTGSGIPRVGTDAGVPLKHQVPHRHQRTDTETRTARPLLWVSRCYPYRAADCYNGIIYTGRSWVPRCYRADGSRVLVWFDRGQTLVR